MSIIIRLQNLPWDASALNIRQFFYGLSIPDGGVHIIGGEKGDAFIAFSTDEDARQAMKNDGGYIGSTPVKLFLSSKAEMQSVIAAAREGSSTSAASVGGGANLESNQSQRMRFNAPTNSGQPAPFGQPNFAAGGIREMTPGNIPMRISFMQQGQQPSQQPQQFVRPVVSDYRSSMDLRPPNMLTNDFRQTTPTSSAIHFPLFNQNPSLADSRAPMDVRQQLLNFDPRQPFHEQKQQPPYWGGQSEKMNEPINQPLYEPFGNNHDKPDFPYKKLSEGSDRSLVPPPAEGQGRRNDWGNRGRDGSRDYVMGSRQDEDYSRLFGMDFGSDHPVNELDHEMRGSVGRRDCEGDYRKSMHHDNGFGPVGGRGSDPNLPSDYGGMPRFDDRIEDHWRGNERPRFGVDRFSPRRDFASPYHVDRGRYDDFKGFCVFVRDIPPFFGPRDIRALFRDCDLPPSRMNIVCDRNGDRIGQAYLRLSCPEEMEAALRENGRMIDGHRIRVTRCHEKDFEEGGVTESRSRHKSRSRSPRHSDQGGYYIVIKNLPGSSFIRKCLADVKISRNGGPFLELGKIGKGNGNALLELEHRRDLDTMLNRHKIAFGGHLAHVYKIPRQEFKLRVKDSRPMSIEDEEEVLKYTCIEIDGLSWSCNEEKVRKFFSGLKILPNTLHIFLDHSGKASGIAYAEFEASTDCSKAMEKHRQYLDNRYLILRMISQDEMTNLLEKHLRTGGRFMNDSYQGSITGTTPGEGNSYGETVVYMKNLNSRTRLEDILEFFHDYKIIPDSIQLQYKDDRPTGDGMVKFVSLREAEDAVKQLNRKTMLGKVVELLF